MTMDLHGERILVTGATGGLGPHLVEALLACGAHVVATARTRTRLDELRASLSHHERLHVAECDTASPAGVEALIEAVDARGGLHAVVHAVGAFVYGPLSERTDTEVDRVIACNLTSTTLVVRGALRRMLPRGRGRIVVVAADRALAPAPNFALYGAVKAGVVHLVQAVAEEVHPSGVRIHALLPGVIDTPGNRAAMPDADPSGWVAPQELAKAAVWLCSSGAQAVNGALVRLPGA
jgi:NAD(P)-dependent dehydrogenase (short-subunit alcohol dehydrogenase family)